MTYKDRLVPWLPISFRASSAIIMIQQLESHRIGPGVFFEPSEHLAYAPQQTKKTPGK